MNGKTYKDIFDDLINSFADVQFNRTFFFKDLQKNDNSIEKNQLIKIKDFMLIKIIWHSNCIVQLKLGFKNYSLEKIK